MTRVKGHYRKGKYIRPYYRREKTNGFIAQRLKEPEFFDPRSFRRIRRGKSLITVACPRGKFKGGVCQVGMQAQSIWRPIE